MLLRAVPSDMPPRRQAVAPPIGAYHIERDWNADAGFPSEMVASSKDWQSMSRMTPFSSPLLLGFDTMEKTLERLAKASDGYPPYNIERIRPQDGSGERLRITVAVAGFGDEELDVSTEENQLIIRGRQAEAQERDYLHRGIAARQFQRVFVLAEGIEVLAAELKNGLLSIDLARPEPQRLVKKINISVRD